VGKLTKEIMEATAKELRKLGGTQAERMARAAEQGHSIARGENWYHGTTKPLTEMAASRAGKQYQMNISGVHLTDTPSFAGRYAEGEGGNIIPASIIEGNQLDATRIIDKGSLEESILNDLLKGTGQKPYWSKNENGIPQTAPLQNYIDSVSAKKAESVLDKYGIDSVKYEAKFGTPTLGGAYIDQKATSVLMRDPARVRSVNADFNPEYSDSPNLLAGIAGAMPYAGATAALLAGATGSQEAEAGGIGEKLRANKETQEYGSIEPPKNPTALQLADAIRALDRRTKGSPVNLLVPTATGEFLSNVGYNQKTPTFDKFMTALEWLP